MISNDLIESRISKLKKLKELGVDAYPSIFVDKMSTDSIRQKGEGTSVTTAGRILSLREHGSITFSDLHDEKGKIQLAFKRDTISSERYDFLKLLDTGDFLCVKGKTFITKAGELTIEVEEFTLLSKSLRPLPSVWYGLKDQEERYRQRYVDFILNPELKDLVRKKSVFWSTIRNFLIEKGFLEVETPVLENTAGGADANPFVTHHNTLDMDVYLRISMGELWQKRLMVAGFEKTFEIGRQFRNEGISREHLQDYSQMEFYWAYATYKEGMELVEELYKKIAFETFGTYTFEIGDHKVNLENKWGTLSYPKALSDFYGKPLVEEPLDTLRKVAKEHDLGFSESDERGRLLDILWKKVRKNVSGPVFLVDQPVSVSPLAKRKAESPALTEKYQVILAGSEMGNGYSELNDPIDQAKRFLEQQNMRDKGDLDAQMYDRDFVRALEYGMPPVTGFGVSERLFSFLAGKSIRECVTFPLLRPEEQVENIIDVEENL